jgi:hypothetical protein
VKNEKGGLNTYNRNKIGKREVDIFHQGYVPNYPEYQVCQVERTTLRKENLALGQALRETRTKLQMTLQVLRNIHVVNDADDVC